MTDKPGGKWRGSLRTLGIGCALFSATFFLYVASSGPANGLQARGYIDWDTLQAIYGPLDSLADQDERLSDAYYAYQRLFLPAHHGKPDEGMFRQPTEIAPTTRHR